MVLDNTTAIPATTMLENHQPGAVTKHSQAIAWLILGVATLGASTLFAILVAASRSPATAQLLSGNDFFHVALILHVTLGPVLCFLAFAMLLWNMGIANNQSARAWDVLGWLGIGLAITGSVVLILVPAGNLIGISPGEHVLSNYIPVLRSPLFLSGLVLFCSGFLLALIRILSRLRPGKLSPNEQVLGWGLLAAALAGIVALASMIWGGLRLPDGMAPETYYEILFWGPGHTLQSMHVLMMMVAWIILADAAGITLRSAVAMQRSWFLLAALPVLAAPLIYLAYPLESPEFRSAFTELMRWAIWPGVALLAVDIIYSIVQRGRSSVRWTAATWSLLLSIILLFIGVAIGFSINENNAVVPAHYHATTGAITMAYLGIALVFLRRIAGAAAGATDTQSKETRWPVLAYGTGTLLMAVAMGWAGLAGMTRKVPGSEKVLEGYSMHLTFIAIGGTLVIIGGIGLVVIMFRSWLRTSTLERWKSASLLSVTGLIILIGLVFTLFPGPNTTPAPASQTRIDPMIDPDGHMQQVQTAEINERFQQAVMMLHAKRFDLAIAPLQRVLTLAPNMPEAHVNLGFALLELKHYEDARTSFQNAIELHEMQVNAYYGLALVMHEMKEVDAAVGTMRSYIHLAAADDPYLNQARAKLAEWEKARGRRPGGELPAVKSEHQK